jgi:diguanylate cyclase (GGDEF)-like protein
MHDDSVQEIADMEQLGLLIVDDDVDILNLINLDFKSDYKVYSAFSVVQAMDILKKNEIHIAICDERLKGDSGSELLTVIKDEYPDIVRILISGYKDATAILNAINRASVFKFLMKPLTPEYKDVIDEARNFYIAGRKNQYKDSLTNLKSENTILDRLASELKRSFRYDVNLSTILLSIENPKKDSALHGFLIDRLLIKKVAEILEGELRHSDTAGRLRDNRFLVLLTETDSSGTDVFLNRFMKKIDEFETQINRGLLPYKVQTSKLAMNKAIKMDNDKLMTELYSKLSDFDPEKK